MLVRTLGNEKMTISYLKEQKEQELLDLIVVGGGINGAGIAVDAAGRGLKVGLYETKDFAGATSSASSKFSDPKILTSTETIFPDSCRKR